MNHRIEMFMIAFHAGLLKRESRKFGDVGLDIVNLAIQDATGTYQESCPLGVLELNTFLKLTSI
jgi:hypothetical protein